MCVCVCVRAYSYIGMKVEILRELEVKTMREDIIVASLFNKPTRFGH